MAQPHPPGPQPSGSKGDADPSMDEILASIRRILSDEDKAAKEKASTDGVLMLDPSMMIDDSTAPDALAGAHEHDPHAPETHAPDPHAPGTQAPEPHAHDAPPPPLLGLEPAPHAAPPDPPPLATLAPPTAPPTVLPAPGEPLPASAPLIAPEAAAAAASSVGALVRLAAERNLAVHRSGPTIEDMVREELRPLLKTWLDTHLPAIVERLVRAEIERVVSRVGP